MRGCLLRHSLTDNNRNYFVEVKNSELMLTFFTDIHVQEINIKQPSILAIVLFVFVLSLVFCRVRVLKHIIIIIIKVFLKHKILSLETILSMCARTHTHTHTEAPTHTSILTIQS